MKSRRDLWRCDLGWFSADFFLGGTLPKAKSLNLKIGLLPKGKWEIHRPLTPTIDFHGLLLSVLGQGKITIPCMKLILGPLEGSNFMQQMYGYFFGAILRTFALHGALFGFCNAMTLCFAGPPKHTIEDVFFPIFPAICRICSQEEYLRFPSLKQSSPKNRVWKLSKKIEVWSWIWGMELNLYSLYSVLFRV